MTMRRTVVAFVVFTALIGAGAAAGVQLSGEVVGVTETSVSTSLIVMPGEFSSENVTFSDDDEPPMVVDTASGGDRFSVSFNANESDNVTVNLPIENRANTDLTGLIELTISSGPENVDTNKLNISAAATGAADLGDICEITNITTESNSSENITAINFEAPSVMDRDETCADLIEIEIELNGPGFYRFEGALGTIAL